MNQPYMHAYTQEYEIDGVKICMLYVLIERSRWHIPIASATVRLQEYKTPQEAVDVAITKVIHKYQLESMGLK